jgi:hypothetical protein
MKGGDEPAEAMFVTGSREDLYRGIASAMPSARKVRNGFSHCEGAQAAAKAREFGSLDRHG